MPNKKYSNFKEEPYYRKSKHKKHSNKTHQNSSSKKNDKKEIKCFKCGKKGHITSNCRVKEIIANLDVRKHLKQQMINLIKTKSQLESSNQTSVETSDEDQLLLIEDDSSNKSNESSSRSSCDCVENCLCNIKQLNVIISEQNFLMKLIDKILDPHLQRDYFKKYLEVKKQSNEKQIENKNQYSLRIVLDQFSKL